MEKLGERGRERERERARRGEREEEREEERGRERARVRFSTLASLVSFQTLSFALLCLSRDGTTMVWRLQVSWMLGAHAIV